MASTVIVGGGIERAGKAGTGGTALLGLAGASIVADIEGRAIAPGEGILADAVARRTGRGGTARGGEFALESRSRDKIASAFALERRFCSTRNATLLSICETTWAWYASVDIAMSCGSVGRLENLASLTVRVSPLYNNALASNKSFYSPVMVGIFAPDL